MNDYQREQWDALQQMRGAFSRLEPADREEIWVKIQPYLQFRRQVDAFQTLHFQELCSQGCFENRLSACCSKDSIVIFWADLVINDLLSGPAQSADLDLSLAEPYATHKCTYLGRNGCRWQMRPLMCAMFLCDAIKARVFSQSDRIQLNWETLFRQANEFRWPDRPVLFDWLETYFMAIGVRSSLMHINTSPGLLSVKRKAGLL